MKRSNWSILITVISVCLSLLSYGSTNKEAELQIEKLELGFPSPAIPFYHVMADVKLPSASMIEVEVIFIVDIAIPVAH